MKIRCPPFAPPVIYVAVKLRLRHEMNRSCETSDLGPAGVLMSVMAARVN